MTPLAQMIIKDVMSKNQEERRSYFEGNIDDVRFPGARKTEGLVPLNYIEGFHFFETSEVMDQAASIGWDIANGKNVSHELFFLPAPKTWIEWKAKDGLRQAIAAFPSAPGRARIRIDHVFRTEDDFIMVNNVTEFLSTEELGNKAIGELVETDFFNVGFHATVASLLVLINSPRVIGRRQVIAHQGLQRKILNNKTLVGKFPLLAYTELRLEIGPPRDISSKQPVEAKLSGDRCLHFVREHLRLVGGSLRRVRAHWRGDPSLGIKRTRYRLAPPKPFSEEVSP